MPVGTLSRIPTAIPGPPQNSAVGAQATTTAGGGGGAAAAGALLTIGAPPVTTTPLVRIVIQPQPTIAFPPR